MDLLTQRGSGWWQVILFVYINQGVGGMVWREGQCARGNAAQPPGGKSSSVTFSYLPNFSVPPFPHLKLGDGNTIYQTPS